MSLSPKVIEILKASTEKPSVEDELKKLRKAVANAEGIVDLAISSAWQAMWSSDAWESALKIAAIELAEAVIASNVDVCFKEAAAYRAIRDITNAADPKKEGT